MSSSSWKTACVLVVSGMISAAAVAGEYRGPCDVVAGRDGTSLFVLCADAGEIAVVDPAAGKVIRTIQCPAKPSGLALSPDGAVLYVTCAVPHGTVSAIDVRSGQASEPIAVGYGATAPCVTPDGLRLYVCNQFLNSVSVVDVKAKKEVGRVPVIREPIGSAVTPDGKTVFVTNLLPIDPSDSYDVAASVSAIDTASGGVSHIRLPNGSSSVRGVCVSPDGKYAYAVHILSRYQMPTTQLERGWMNTNAMSIIDVHGKKLVNTVLLDDIDLGAANPWDVATTADGSVICVTHAATHEVSVIDAKGLLEKLLAMPASEEEARQQGRYDERGTYSSVTVDDVPNDLAFLVGLKRRINLQGRSPWTLIEDEGPPVKGPRGLAVVGSKAYAAVYFSDLVAVVDLEDRPGKLVSAIPLGPTPVLTAKRRGEMYFHDADLCFQHWQSCSSCHPGARMDGLNWDLMNDGLGNPKNVKSMLLAHQTPPSMSTAIRPDAESAVRSGITHIQFAVRPDEDAAAIDEYLKSLEPLASPHLVDGRLSEAAERGKAIFFSDRVGCFTCHPDPLYTDMKMHDVRSRGHYDRRDDFDTPTLIECWRTAPYMHDGHYPEMKELFSQGKHGKFGGDVEGLSDAELNDLIEFVLSL